MSRDRQLGAARILVVDDDESIRDAVATALRYTGLTVDEAANGRDALIEVERSKPDLVILDRRLPEIEGTQVRRILRERGIAIPILFLSATDATEHGADALEATEDDYIAKPFSLDAVLARVQALLERALEHGTKT